jgi:RNA recognition motif-containing protein
VSVRLYIGNLPKELERQELEEVFADAGESVSTKLVTDRKTGKCRGFAFVTVPTDEEADALIEKYNGFNLKETSIKIEKALPRAKTGKEGGEAPPLPAPSGAGGAKPRKASTGSSGGGSGGGSGNANRSAANSSNSGGRSKVVSSGGPEGFQPDPRWASELEKLKALLAEAQ